MELPPRLRRQLRADESAHRRTGKPLCAFVGEDRVDARVFVVGEGGAFDGREVFQQLRGTACAYDDGRHFRQVGQIGLWWKTSMRVTQVSISEACPPE